MYATTKKVVNTLATILGVLILLMLPLGCELENRMRERCEAQGAVFIKQYLNPPICTKLDKTGRMIKIDVY